MRFSLRTLIIVMLVGGPLLAFLWSGRHVLAPLLFWVGLFFVSVTLVLFGAALVSSPFLIISEMAFWLRRKQD